MGTRTESALLARMRESFAGLIPPGAFDWNDDAALLPSLAPGMSRVVSVDQAIEGVHFLASSGLDSAGWRLVVRNVSDLAAMGATPAGMVWTLALPRSWLAADAAMLNSFLAGAAKAARRFRVPLLGGDLAYTLGAFHGTVTIFGDVGGQPLRRSGARVGDLVALSRPLGWSQLGLDEVLGSVSPLANRALRRRARRAHLWPAPELAVGGALADVASACLDVSDGLVRDAGRLAAASKVALVLDEAGILEGAPTVGGRHASLDRVLISGDEYALLFTIPPERPLPRGAQIIGSVESGDGVYLGAGDMPRRLQPHLGFDHFSRC